MKTLFQLLMATLLLGTTGAHALPITYTASLSGAAENPPNASPGHGTVEVQYDPTAHTLFVDMDFADLSGTTTAAHIHCCAIPAANAGVATTLPTFPGFPLGVTSGAYLQLFDLTLPTSFSPSFVTANGGTIAGAEAALANGLAAGRAYFNVHTTVSPGGEVRGNLARVPEPATVLLLGLGIAALAAARGSRHG